MLSTILIIDKRKELSIKYKKSIEDVDTNVIIAKTLNEALIQIQALEPDMIIISDSIDEELGNFCQKIRALTYNSRPIIIAMSKSAEIEDKILILKNGADDFLSEPVNIEEFKMRVKAHLRRDIESNLDNKTLLPNQKYVRKTLKRVLSSGNQAVLLASFENLDNYKAVYTELATDKLKQTFVAIVKSAIDVNDFIGHYDDKSFIIVTNKYNAEKLVQIEEEQVKLDEQIKKIMMTIPNIVADSVPVGKDDSENVEVQKFGEPVVPEYEIPYHADILERFNGLDKDASGRTSGNGFYYLMGDPARLTSAMISYARDFMINKGFTYCIPPFMIRSDVVTGVMSFAEMDAMMYKIEGEDLFLIGTSEHSMIGKFKDQILKEDCLPYTLTSYSPCFRKEVGAHGIEERGIYRVHQFEKQEMVVICKPEDSMEWYEKMWQYTVEVFRNLNIPVRQLECCSGDLADLKVKSCDIEAWSPRQQKYFEVGSCSTLGEAQSRRLGIRVKGEKGNYYPHTLNNTVLASTRALIAFMENNMNEDGSVNIPEALRPYMGGMEKMVP